MDKQYVYYVDGVPVEVSRDVYEVLIQSDNKMRYFEKELKAQKVIRKYGKPVIRPSREDSLERLLELNIQFADNSANVEDAAISLCMTELLCECLDKLSDTEIELIKALYYQGYSEREWSAVTGIPNMTIHDRKVKILSKMKKLMEI